MHTYRWLALSLLLLASPAWAAIAHDNTNSSSQTGTNTLTFSHTCTGSNLMLIVSAPAEDSTAADRLVSSITYGGVAMTEVDNRPSGGVQTANQWYLIGPATGANDVVITWGGNVTAGVGIATSLTGVAQQAPEAEGEGSGTGGSPITCTVTTVTANAWVIDGAVIADPNKALTPGAGQIERAEVQDGGPNVNTIVTTEGPVASPAATVMSNTWVNNNRDWGTVASAYAAAPEGNKIYNGSINGATLQ